MVVVINSETMGNGNETLGKKLIGAFLKKLWLRTDKPEALVLYNGGVRLLDKEVGYLDVLTGLEEAGVDILACGTCLDFYGMKDTIAVGRISNMEEIVHLISTSEKVFTL